MHQLEVVAESHDLDWGGVRPLQMVRSERHEQNRLGYDTFSGMSRIYFAGCAHAMFDDDTWLHEAPTIQYQALVAAGPGTAIAAGA